MQFTSIYLWKKAPFLRLLIPFIIGILLQFYLAPPIRFCVALCISMIIVFILFNFFSLKQRFAYYWIAGIAVNCICACLGALILYLNKGENDKASIQNNYKEEQVIVTIQEPLIAKNKSYKANASAEYIGADNNWQAVTGNLIIYFSKDSILPDITYGSQILITKKLQPIKNAGNPASFDYQRYCAFQHIYYQVFLTSGDYVILEGKQRNAGKQFLFATTNYVTGILQKYIKGKKELGLAEALLIGYKNDLDKELVQSYSNTGVVHIIAISGLHLGVIYLLLAFMLRPLGRNKTSRILKPVIIIVVLWLFSILSGGSPSVLRSSVMFTCIVVGESFSKRTSIYNNLAISAFLLLCYNPFWLWDVGFQLSYSALLSIVVFTQPIYRLMYVKNKLLDKIWQTAAATIAAQLLTTPLSIYYFHQFPNLFLFTNILAVPISMMVLIGEIILCMVSFLMPVAFVIGKIVEWLTWAMNTIIERTDSMPFSTWSSLQINVIETIVIYMIIVTFTLAFMQKNKRYFFVNLVVLLGFAVMRTYSFYRASVQQRMIVYSIPQKQAIDFIAGRKCQFVGDNDLLRDDFLQNFHLKPSRILQRVSCDSNNIHGEIVIFNRSVLIIDNAIVFAAHANKLRADVIIISHNPKLQISNVIHAFDCGIIVFDASNADWQIAKWKKESERLGQKYYSVKDEGAFVYDFK